MNMGFQSLLTAGDVPVLARVGGMAALGEDPVLSSVTEGSAVVVLFSRVLVRLVVPRDC